MISGPFTCKHCDTPFYRSYTNGTTPVYCSRKCRDNARTGQSFREPQPIPTHTCQHCGNTFEKAKRGKEHWPPKYCSRKCAITGSKGIPHGARTDHQSFFCKNCGQEVTDFPSRKGRLFCSRACQIAYAYTTIHCLHCWKEMCVLKSRKHKQFCSNECYKAHKVGVCNANWKGGNCPYYYGPDWPKIAEQARQRDGYKCQRCGKPQEDNYRALDVHHIQPFTSFGPRQFAKANKLENLLTLCHPCHMAIEGKPADDW